ncbi:hypothetical protein [Deinococcus malanensis]|uniref:hypothetical protein n=1 Tax=Deinococcus malanensis TaxID=1706855 RepID=UPI001663ABB0|nr:hypothetical protein [Deinococcus malanensis]
MREIHQPITRPQFLHIDERHFTGRRHQQVVRTPVEQNQFPSPVQEKRVKGPDGA